MFETLFQYPAIVTRHRRGPFAEARERFLNHCTSQGLARATLQRYAQELLVIAQRYRHFRRRRDWVVNH
jgi:hypothetical protein